VEQEDAKNLVILSHEISFLECLDRKGPRKPMSIRVVSEMPHGFLPNRSSQKCDLLQGALVLAGVLDLSLVRIENPGIVAIG
jgi:hypothetical protein